MIVVDYVMFVKHGGEEIGSVKERRLRFITPGEPFDGPVGGVVQLGRLFRQLTGPGYQGRVLGCVGIIGSEMWSCSVSTPSSS